MSSPFPPEPTERRQQSNDYTGKACEMTKFVFVSTQRRGHRGVDVMRLSLMPCDVLDVASTASTEGYGQRLMASKEVFETLYKSRTVQFLSSLHPLLTM